jgi:DNA-binding PadR family transcriptional regulator
MSRSGVPEPRPTTSSYALLGLLNLRSWTTYELAKQVQRSLNWFWPRAERKLYDEPKTLAALGMAVADERFTGRRRSREYTITDTGREALAQWLSEPPGPRTTEFEGLIKVFFADSGDLGQLRTTLDRIEAEAVDRISALAAMAGERVAFPSRLHISALCLPLQLEQETAVLSWVRWARAQVADWTSTTDPGGWDGGAVLASLASAAHEAAPAPSPLPS